MTKGPGLFACVCVGCAGALGSDSLHIITLRCIRYALLEHVFSLAYERDDGMKGFKHVIGVEGDQSTSVGEGRMGTVA